MSTRVSYDLFPSMRCFYEILLLACNNGWSGSRLNIKKRCIMVIYVHIFTKKN